MSWVEIERLVVFDKDGIEYVLIKQVDALRATFITKEPDQIVTKGRPSMLTVDGLLTIPDKRNSGEYIVEETKLRLYTDPPRTHS